MSEFRDVISDIVSDRQTFTGDVITNLRTDVQFVGEVEEIQDIELNTELGRDARESMLVHVQGRNLDIEEGDRLQVQLLGEIVGLKVCRRKNNPASPLTEYGCMKLTDKDK